MDGPAVLWIAFNARQAIWNMRHQDDDYADLVGAGFAIFCSALLLVAFFLFVLPKLEHTDVAPQERPGAASPLMSSNAHSS